MVDVVEETQNVNVDYKMHGRLIDKELDSSHGMVCRSKGSETVTMLVKLGFSYGLKNLLEALLNDAIEDTWNAERPPFAIIFFNKLPSDFLGAVVLQSVLDIAPFNFSSMFLSISSSSL